MAKKQNNESSIRSKRVSMNHQQKQYFSLGSMASSQDLGMGLLMENLNRSDRTID